MSIVFSCVICITISSLVYSWFHVCRRGVALCPCILRWDVFICCSLGGFSVSFCSWVGCDSANIWRSTVLCLLLGGTKCVCVCVLGLHLWNNLELIGEVLAGSSVCGGEVFYSLRSVAMRGPSFRSRFFCGFLLFLFFLLPLVFSCCHLHLHYSWFCHDLSRYFVSGLCLCVSVFGML